MNSPLSWMMLAPLVGMLSILLIPGRARSLIRWTAAAAAGMPLALAGWLVAHFDRNATEFQFTERHDWIPAFDIQYFVGVDGLGVAMVLLSTLLTFIGILASWRVEKALKTYFALFLLLGAAMTGVFVALDLVLFFLFWELVLLPMYFLIGIWGGPRRDHAALKFLLFTMAGSAFILVAMLALYFASDPHAFDLAELVAARDQFPHSLQYVLWLAFFVGFAVKIPAFPLHTWLPDAHVEAPAPISAVLAGVLLKMGAFGIVRVNFALFPEATADLAVPCLGVLGAVNIVYGAFCALGQTDLKRMIAYSSISHMGFVLLGLGSLTAHGVDGAALQMFNHGIGAALLFLLAGALHERTHHLRIDGFGGLGSVMPVYTGIAGLAFFAALGLPGLSLFVSELLVLLGAWQRYPELAAAGAVTVVLTAGYFLRALQRIFLGPLNEAYVHLPDARSGELVTLVPLALILLGMGLYPQPFLDLVDASLQHFAIPSLPFL